MPTLPILPVELWYQILSYVVTPTRPVAVQNWSCPMPVFEFAPEDADVQKSLTLFTGPAASSVPLLIPLSPRFIYRTLISQSRWLLQRSDYAIADLVLEYWPCAPNARIPYARDLARLQATFKAPVQAVDIVIDCADSFKDGYFNWRLKYALGDENQWATAQTGHISAVLETCRALRSLRVFLDGDGRGMRPGTTSLDMFYRSDDFCELWKVTAPKCYGDTEWNPVKEWREECEKRGIEFGIVARLEREDGSGMMEEDLTEFWDLPEEVMRDGDLWCDQGLAFAIEAHAARRMKKS